MGRITLKQAAQWCGGQIDPKYADVSFFGATNDSRNVTHGQLFVALQGARDGHEFIPMALDNGAAAVLCSHCDGDFPAIVVENPHDALGQIAREERRRLGMKVVGVTGSVGKSTTKEMIACVLASRYRTGRSPANHNNDLGLPMAILGLADDTEVAVLEMGMNHFREIGYLTAIAQPDVAVIINIGTMHIEHLGSREGILQAKMEILEGLRPGGKVILNGDDSWLWNAQQAKPYHPVFFGAANRACGILASEVKETPGRICFQVTRGETTFPVELPLEGIHHVDDALAAIAVGLEMGVAPAQIQKGLYHFRNMAGRQEIFEAKGCTIIKDCYNAGPESMAAALTVLGNRPGRHVAVLGDMLELGARAQAEHYKIGRIAAEKAQLLLAYGPNGVRVVSGALTGGMPESRARCFEDREALTVVLRRMVKPGDVILFKGSHGMHMELILEQFLKDET